MTATKTPDPDFALGASELAVLEVLLSRAGRVVSREVLRRATGMQSKSERRCDSIIVLLRRTLGDGAIITVRSRGWMLDPQYCEPAVALLSST